MLSGGQLAALIIALFLAILVVILSYALLRLTRVLAETTKLISGVTDRALPLLDEMTATVRRADGQLEQEEAINRNVESMTDSVSKLATLLTAVVGGPMARMAGLRHGARKAIVERDRGDVQRRVKAETRAVRRARLGARREVRS